MRRRPLILVAAAIVTGLGVAIARLVVGPPPSGTAGASADIGNDFVVIDYGYVGEDVTYVAVLNWPRSLPTSQRRDDRRFNELDIPPTYRDEDGTLRRLHATPHLYFYDGESLTCFPIQMTEEELEDVELEMFKMKDYRDALPLLRRYEVPSR